MVPHDSPVGKDKCAERAVIAAVLSVSCQVPFVAIEKEVVYQEDTPGLENPQALPDHVFLSPVLRDGSQDREKEYGILAFIIKGKFVTSGSPEIQMGEKLLSSPDHLRRKVHTRKVPISPSP